MVNYLYDLHTIEANHEAYRQPRHGRGIPRSNVNAAISQPCSLRKVRCLRTCSRPSEELSGRSRPRYSWAADGQSLSYADLVEFSGRVANALTSLGVKPGDRVAAQVEKSAEALLVYLGALRAGAVYLPLNSAYTAGEVRYFLGDAEPVLFVCRPEVAAEMRACAARLGVPRVETLGRAGDGSLMDAGSSATVAGDRGCPAYARRSRRLPLHLRDDRALEGCDAQPWQSRLERRGPA